MLEGGFAAEKWARISFHRTHSSTAITNVDNILQSYVYSNYINSTPSLSYHSCTITEVDAKVR